MVPPALSLVRLGLLASPSSAAELGGLVAKFLRLGGILTGSLGEFGQAAVRKRVVGIHLQGHVEGPVGAVDLPSGVSPCQWGQPSYSETCVLFSTESQTSCLRYICLRCEHGVTAVGYAFKWRSKRPTMHLVPMSDPTATETDAPLEHQLSQAAAELRRAISAVVNRLPVRAKKPAEFQRVLKLDRSLSSRILRAIQLDDPLASLHRMPGPHGIRLLLRAAGKCADIHDLIERAENALDEVEHLVHTELGEWKALEVAISGWLPDSREQFELNNRQAAFKAMSNIRGVTADAEISITLIHPSGADKPWLDRAGITGICRMKRLRPGTPMGLLHGSSIAPPAHTQRLSLEGQPIDPLHGAPLLREFCPSSTPQFEVRVEGDMVHYVLLGDRVGVGSMVDLYFADVMRDRYPVNDSVSPRPATPGAVIDIPVKTLIVDVLVHEDVWQSVKPELRMYDTAGRGIANPTDSSRDMDRIDTLESIQNMGTNGSRFRTKEVAHYLDMVRHVCKKLGWESDRFRGYRCRVEYPVYGTQVSMVFEPPSGDTGRQKG